MRHVFLQNALSEVPPWTLIHSTTRKAFHQRSCFSCLPKNIWQISMLLLLWVRLTSKSEGRVPTRSPWLQTLLHTWGHADLSIHPTTGYKFGVPHKYFSISVNSHRTQESTVFRSSFIIAKVYKFKSPKGRVRKSREEAAHRVSGSILPMESCATFSWPQCMPGNHKSSSKLSMARDFIGVQRGSTQMIGFSSSAHSRDSDQYFWSPVSPEVITDAASQSTYHKFDYPVARAPRREEKHTPSSVQTSSKGHTAYSLSSGR